MPTSSQFSFLSTSNSPADQFPSEAPVKTNALLAQNVPMIFFNGNSTFKSVFPGKQVYRQDLPPDKFSALPKTHETKNLPSLVYDYSFTKAEWQ